MCCGGSCTGTEVLFMRGDNSALSTFWHASEEKKKSFWFPKPGYDNHQRISNVIANMKKLRWIVWEEYPPSSFSSKFQPTRLVCLMLRCSRQKQLWKGFKSLPSLKILDLQHSYYLKRTPDFKGLPCLERLKLEGCKRLKEIHPSIGYHERLVWVNMKGCLKVKWFPPIIHMIKLETLVLSDCEQLKKFPDIQTRMDSLVNLHLDGTGIEIVPPSVGKFCTNLVFFDLRRCSKLERIEGNFLYLKRMKYQMCSGSQIKKLAGDECCLEKPSIYVSTPKVLQYPCFLIKLDISKCELGDGDMPSDMSGLINLQVLDLMGNKFSQLHSSLSKIPCLKFLNLSWCGNLVELPDLPSSIAILIAESCNSLQSVGDLSNYKWLWKVSLWRTNEKKLIGGERVAHSMIQRNAVEDRFMSIALPITSNSDKFTMMIRKLPYNLYDNYSGFLFSASACSMLGCRIYIKKEMLSMDSQHGYDHWEEYNDNPESFNECEMVCYVPFGSLSHASWWNPIYSHITFRFKNLARPKVGLVPRKSKSRVTPLQYSECWEEEIGTHEKTFQIINNPMSLQIEIKWLPHSLYSFI